MGNLKQEEKGEDKRKSRIVFFLRSNRFLCLISFIMALVITCVLIFVVVSKYIIVTALTGIVMISSMAIVLSFFIFVPIKYFTQKN